MLHSSGTTGLPKPIVHGQGGILLEYLKMAHLHFDLRPGDRLFWFTTTGWMMWNLLLAGLFTEAAVVLYDGSPGHPDLGVLWDLAAETGITCFGTSAAFISSCMKAGLEPGQGRDLSRIRSLGSTGSPLSPDGFRWVYDHVGRDTWLFSMSGGTDVGTAFVGGVPTLPVNEGELQARALGAKVEAFDEEGHSIVDRVGELVLTEPFPSMPVFFWGDEDGSRYRESYFDTYPGIWRHGDWIEITSRGTAIITRPLGLDDKPGRRPDRNERGLPRRAARAGGAGRARPRPPHRGRRRVDRALRRARATELASRTICGARIRDAASRATARRATRPIRSRPSPTCRERSRGSCSRCR